MKKRGRKNRVLWLACGLTFLAGIGTEQTAFGQSLKSAKVSVGQTAAATVASAAAVLDLRTVKVPEGANVSADRQVGSLTYELPGEPKTAFQFHRDELKKLGWTELPGSTVDAAYANGMFSKSGFTINCSVSANGQEGKNAGSFVSLINFGNVPLKTVPILKGSSLIFANEASAFWVTDVAPSTASDQMMNLLRQSGWKFYGRNKVTDEQQFLTVRKNAVQISVMVDKAPAQGNRTSIMVSSLLLSAELPAPDSAEQLHFDGSTKTLRFMSKEGFAEVGKFYSTELPASEWKPTTAAPVESDDEFGRPTALQVYRNSAKDLIYVEMRKQDDQTWVTVKHQTKQELEIAEQRAKEAAKEQSAREEADKKASRDRQMPNDEPNVDIDALADSLIEEAVGIATGGRKARGTSDSGSPGKDAVHIALPAGAKLDQVNKNSLRVTIDSGKGKATAEFVMDHLEEAGWKVDEEDISDSTGNVTFAKERAQITLTWVDTGIARVTMMIIGIGTDINGGQKDGSPRSEVNAGRK